MPEPLPETPEEQLIAGIRQNKVDWIRAAIAAGADVNKRLRGTVPIMAAVCEARLEMVEILIEHGADFTTPEPETGFTPLSQATFSSGQKPDRHLSKRAIKESKHIADLLRRADATR